MALEEVLADESVDPPALVRRDVREREDAKLRRRHLRAAHFECDVVHRGHAHRTSRSRAKMGLGLPPSPCRPARSAHSFAITDVPEQPESRMNHCLAEPLIETWTYGLLLAISNGSSPRTRPAVSGAAPGRLATTRLAATRSEQNAIRMMCTSDAMSRRIYLTPVGPDYAGVSAALPTRRRSSPVTHRGARPVSLLGIAVLVLGFALRANPLLIAMAAALVTGLAAAWSPGAGATTLLHRRSPERLRGVRQGVQRQPAT